MNGAMDCHNCRECGACGGGVLLSVKPLKDLLIEIAVIFKKSDEEGIYIGTQTRPHWDFLIKKIELEIK